MKLVRGGWARIGRQEKKVGEGGESVCVHVCVCVREREREKEREREVREREGSAPHLAEGEGFVRHDAQAGAVHCAGAVHVLGLGSGGGGRAAGEGEGEGEAWGSDGEHVLDLQLLEQRVVDPQVQVSPPVPGRGGDRDRDGDRGSNG